MYFVDRSDAGRRLAARLLAHRGPEVVVVGLPRGGVPVAAEVARALGAPLDVIVVRKVGVPGQPELAVGAVGEGDVLVVDDEVRRLTGVSDDALAHAETRARAELDDALARFRGGRAAMALTGRTVIVVDDGVATGSTARAACRVARARGAARVVLAVPVAPAGWIDRMGDAADEYVAVMAPADLQSVGQAYHEFEPVDDALVRACLRDPGADDPTLVCDRDVTVRIGELALRGCLRVPERAIGTVVFAHGAGSSHASPRNRYMAAVLNQARVATLLVDLLAADEARDRTTGFDIPLLGARIVGASRWVREEPGLADLPLGYVGASTGAPAAFWAVAEGGSDAVAVVSRGGRADLAHEWLGRVRCPTLLIVGGHDDQVLALNREAMFHLHGEVRLAVVPGATHLFAEPGALDLAAGLARDFLVRHLLRAQRSLAASTPDASSPAMRSSS